MPRNFSQVAIQSANAVETDQVWLILMKIEHPDLDETLYLVNNRESITSDFQVYTAYPFNIVLGNDDGEKLQTVKLTFDNIDVALVEVIRSITESPDITISVVLSDYLDDVEIEITNLKLREVTYDAYTISGILYADDILNQRWPKDQITLAAGYHGLFR